MNLKKFYTHRAIGFLILVAIVGLIATFYLFNNYIYQEKQGADVVIEPYRATLSGEYVCLPHKDTTGPQTEECAFGLKTEAGEYYAVDFYLMSQEHRPLSLGDDISANGLVTPLELLSTNHWQKYRVEGIFSVTDSLQVSEIVKDFEGEADPSRMSLGMKSWIWIRTKYADGKEIKPSGEKVFTLSFNNNQTFSLTTDCNSVGGKYKVNKSKITFNEMMSTFMYCEGSLESNFVKMLSESESYIFTSKGELILNLKLGNGSVIFR